MRENRPYGSEGGAGFNSPLLPLSTLPRHTLLIQLPVFSVLRDHRGIGMNRNRQ